MATCELCGDPMPPGEEMFKFHGYSGPCPKPPLSKPELSNLPDDTLREFWRSVQGGNAELTGPLIRFAGLVYRAAKAGAYPQTGERVKTKTELEALRDRVLDMSPADRLRLCVELLERGSYQHAEPIVRSVADELTALRLCGQLKG